MDEPRSINRMTIQDTDRNIDDYSDIIFLNSIQGIRRIIWDKTDGHCWYCGCELNIAQGIYFFERNILEEFTVDHAIPSSRGGSNETDNLLPACRSCNSSKNNKTVEEYLAWLSGATTDEQ